MDAPTVFLTIGIICLLGFAGIVGCVIYDLSRDGFIRALREAFRAACMALRQ